MSENPKPFIKGNLEVSGSSIDSDVEINLEGYNEYISIFLVLDEVKELHQWLMEHIARHE